MKVRTNWNHRETHLVAFKLFICLLLLFHFVKHITIYLNRVQDKHTVLRGASTQRSSECADSHVMLACGYAPLAAVVCLVCHPSKNVSPLLSSPCQTPPSPNSLFNPFCMLCIQCLDKWQQRTRLPELFGGEMYWFFFFTSSENECQTVKTALMLVYDRIVFMK